MAPRTDTVDHCWTCGQAVSGPLAASLRVIRDQYAYRSLVGPGPFSYGHRFANSDGIDITYDGVLWKPTSEFKAAEAERL